MTSLRRWRVGLASVLLASVGCSGGPRPDREVQPAVHRLVYKVEDLTQGGDRVTTQVVDIASPQRARSVLHAGDGASGPSLGGVAWSETQQYLVRTDGTTAVVQDVAPQFAGAAWQLSDSVAFALAHRRASSLGARSVRDRGCNLVRTLEPVDVGELAPATGADHAESCVTADGTLLQDVWSIKGQVVRRRTLVSDGSGPSLQNDGLFAGQTPTPALPGQAVESVKDEDVPTLVKALGIPAPQAPLGLAPGRTVAVIQLDPGGAGVAVEGGVFSWTDGVRLVVLRVERGLTAPLAVGSAGTPVRVGARPVRVQALAVGLRMRFAGPLGLVATVTADVPSTDLLAWTGTVSLG